MTLNAKAHSVKGVRMRVIDMKDIHGTNGPNTRVYVRRQPIGLEGGSWALP